MSAPGLVPSPAAGHTGWLGQLDCYHRMQPAPFNPAYRKEARQWAAQATASMERDGYYDTHTREQCAAEWRRRYAASKEAV